MRVIFVTLVLLTFGLAKADVADTSAGDPVLRRGEVEESTISRSLWMSALVGFGSGQSRQERTYWNTAPYVLTAELLSSSVFAAGILGCAVNNAVNNDEPCASNNENLKKYGGFSFLGFRILSIVDTYLWPRYQNKKLKEKLGNVQATIFILPLDRGVQSQLVLAF